MNSTLDNVTVVIITKNEEANISDCLMSCRDFKHRLILDSGSTDGTQKIAMQLGATVIHQDWLGFGSQKRRAVELAQTDWILSIDADERVSPDLLKAIKQITLDNPTKAYQVNRRSFFLGKEIRFSGWNPDWIVRLFNRKYANFNNDRVHERVVGYETNHKLKGLLHHYSYTDKADVERKTLLYGRLARASRTKQKNRLAAAAFSFFRTYVLRLGALDGRAGFEIAKMNARVTYMKYTKHYAIVS